MTIQKTSLPGVLRIVPRRYTDDRGYFAETWNRRAYAEAGLLADFVQDNLSHSRQGVLRGLHYQHPSAQGKLVSVLAGAVFDVVVDVRRGAATFGQWAGATLSAANGHQLFIPEGFAHGFVVTGETALFSYKCTAFYAPEHERSLRWNDPALGIDWPVAQPILSAKDAAAPLLEDVPAAALPA